MSDKQPEDLDERIRKGDEALVTPFGHPVTTNEWHAMKIGVTGFFAGLTYAAGYDAMAITMAFSLVGYAILGRPIGRKQQDEEATVAKKTIRHEPWWFLIAFGIWFAIGIVTGTVV